MDCLNYIGVVRGGVGDGARKVGGTFEVDTEYCLCDSYYCEHGGVGLRNAHAADWNRVCGMGGCWCGVDDWVCDGDGS